MCWCVQAVIIMYHRLGGLKSRKQFSRSSGAGKFKIKVLAIKVSGEDSP